jgi:transposase
VVGKRILPTVHSQIAILHQEGYSSRQIAQRLSVVQSTVVRSLKASQSTGKFGYKKPSGRPKCTSDRMDNSIMKAAKKSPRKSSVGIHAGLPPDSKPSARTIRRRLFTAGLKSYTPAKKPALTAKNIRDRLGFCNKYRHWTANQWKSVMFSDESMISQFYAFTRHVRRPADTRFSERYIVPTVKNAPKVMVWGAISAKGRSGLWFMPEGTTMNGAVYLDVLKEKLPQFLTIHDCDTFQHDGAPCHQTKAVKDWLGRNNVQLLSTWPGNSPDLNPIENCWVILKRKVAARNPTSLADLKKIIVSVWVQEITPEYCEKLCHVNAVADCCSDR